MSQTLDNLQKQLDHTKAIGDFRSSIQAQVRRLWSGDAMLFDFLDGMNFVLDRHLRIAWAEGAKTCGISANELTPAEIQARDNLINSQYQYLLGFADSIEQSSKAEGGKLSPLFSRSEMWTNRYNEAFERGQGMACADQKAIWILGPTEEHCRSCGGFAGRVYRLSVWEANGATPQTQGLCCHGYRCKCRRELTKERITPGRFPSSLLCG